MNNQRMLDHLHDRWLDPPEPPEAVCEECGSDEDVIHTIYDTYICVTCVEMQEQFEQELLDEEGD